MILFSSDNLILFPDVDILDLMVILFRSDNLFSDVNLPGLMMKFVSSDNLLLFPHADLPDLMEILFSLIIFPDVKVVLSGNEVFFS